MASKTISFSGNQLIIEGKQPFTISDFKPIKSSEETAEVIEVAKNKKETLSIMGVSKSTFDGRFVAIYINEGDKFPYVDKVKKIVRGKIKELDNPRDSEEIEMRGQLFIVVDTQSQRIWLSDQRRKKQIIGWLKEKLGVDIEIKAIIQESNLVDRLTNVSEISFSVVPSLFNQIGQDTLSSKLSEDIYGFDAEKARVQLYYSNKKMTDKIKGKILGIVGKKENFEDICVIGRSDEDFETVFNTDGVVTKLTVSVAVIKETKLFSETEVFRALMQEIKTHDK